MNQSTIYRRHEARRQRTELLKDDPRPAVVRVLSGLPGFSMIIPPYQPAATSPVADKGLAEAPLKFTEATIMTSLPSSHKTEIATPFSVPQVMLVAGASGAAAEYVVQGMARTALPANWISIFSTGALSKPTFTAHHDILAMQQHEVFPNIKAATYFGFPQQRFSAWRNASSLAVSTALLFGSKAFMTNKLGDTSSLASSAFAGAVLATVNIPRQAVHSYLAVLRQSKNVAAPASFTSAAASLVRNQGLGALTRGASVVYGREIAGATLYFGSYEAIKTAMASHETQGASSASVALSGAVAGVLYRGVTHTVDSVFQPGLTARGFLPTVLRAAPIHAVLFLGYETGLSMLSDKTP